MPQGSTILVTGETGTGKSLFGFHFIYEGTEKGESGLIVSLNEDLATLQRNARLFGFDFNLHEEKGLVRALYTPAVDLVPDEHLMKIKEVLVDINRVVIDGFSCYQLALTTRREYENFLLTLISLCKSRGITSIFIADTNPGEYYPYDIAHLADGIITLSSIEERGVKRRYIEVIKMRGSAHVTGKKLMDITSRGLEVSP